MNLGVTDKNGKKKFENEIFERIFNVFETVMWFFYAFFGLWLLSGSCIAFVANLCIAMVGVGLTFVSAYIIIGFCKLVEELLKGDR